MKITVELKDEDRAQLLQLAAQDPNRGLAELVGDAIEQFLASRGRESSRKQRITSLRGSLSGEDADSLIDALSTFRGSWR